ncbi:DmsC/YnfH family molybdoenzyme membrane anchor subunit [uncultured Shimia sp.]|uniref:dimethyl sulfoxide reductase anchor subunit family protein n=1 Tax=uncultured Shimia sp. TaxID=573152 RepID=UPI00261180A4|nr:DmsC/YnfH family molybdoenzyme membrane anchor subunit [uncultured Shimia sp.]
MHPAPSVIVFTTLSGLGFGLLAFLGLGMPDVTGGVAFLFFALGYALAVGGLLAATFHLGNKKNATKAFSQWRTSWLSREGVASVAALLVMAPFAIGRIFLGVDLTALGWIGALLSLGTVFTTSMIYAQLTTVPRWNMRWTPVLFLTHALAGGALLAGQITAAAILLAVLGLILILSWRQGDAQFDESGASLETATGLGSIGTVRQLEPPHSGQNYLLKEMAYQVGRKHSAKLRAIALGLGVVLPVLCLTVLPFSHMIALVAVLSHIAGVAAGRWLFFAEAKHVVSLYYGR